MKSTVRPWIVGAVAVLVLLAVAYSILQGVQ